MSNMRTLERVTLTKVVTCEGEGTKQSVCREVTWYYDDHGELLWKRDPCPEQEKGPLAASTAAETKARGLAYLGMCQAQEVETT
jgi:hypothetical protein